MARRRGQVIARGKGVWLVKVYRGQTIEQTDEGAKVRLRYTSETVRGTRKDAETVLSAKLTEQDRGVYVEPSRETLDAWLDHWLATSAPRRANTRAEYEAVLKRYVRPTLGSRRLRDVQRTDLKGLYAGMEARGLSPRTIRYAHTVLSAALKAAVEDHKLARNPAAGLKLPKRQRQEMHAMSPEQAAAFQAAAATSPHGLLFTFALATGMRPSEYVALRWRDLDLKAGTATVQRVVLSTGARGTFAEPKTVRSRRTVPLPAGVAARLREHYMAAGRPDADALVFPGSHGQPLDAHNIAQRHFKPLAKAAGLPAGFRLYDLRHSCATLLLAAGVNPKVVSERLGHASITLTLDTYSHVLPNMQQEATAKLDAVLFGGAPR